MIHVSRPALACFLFCIHLLAAAAAEDRDTTVQKPSAARDADKSQTHERAGDLAMLTKFAAGYTLKLEKDRGAELGREPAFRWSNSLAGTRDAALFVWTADDRPVALGTIIWYPKRGVFHELQSLALEPLTAERGGEKVWEPAPPGIKFVRLHHAPQPKKRRRSTLSR